MEELRELKNELSTQRPVSWENMPDIELYMDQVLNYMPRQQIAYRPDVQLTSAMVNNYIKEGLLSHANKKKYAREHLANLTAICLLKQVLSVKDINLLLKQESAQQEPNLFYSKLEQILDAALTDVSDSIPEKGDPRTVSDTALRLAIASYANQLACERLLDLIRSEQPEERHEKAKQAAGTKGKTIES